MIQKMKHLSICKGVTFLFNIIKNNIIVIVAIPFIIGIFIWLNNSEKSDVFTNVDGIDERQSEMDDIVNDNDLFKEDTVIVVDIKGEVKKPGVYEFQDGARVNDLVTKAGGFLQSADETQVNLAQKLQDEMIVIVPPQGDEQQQTIPNGVGNDEQIVKINYATINQLETLPGIGPSKAQAIIDHRDEYGLFKSKEDLLNVSGIGEKTLENLEQHIQVP